jgi:hypoxanthine-DNA glycosylase
VKISLLTDQRIALWDVVSACCRQGSADAGIRTPVFNNLHGFFQSCPTLRLIVLNGTSAGHYFKLMKIPVPVPAVVLPSTSPANTRYSLDEKIQMWKIIHSL